MADDHANFVARAVYADPELQRHFPTHPRLNSGVQAVPFGRDGVLLLGGESDVVMHGAGLRHLLNDLLPLLNGEREAERIAEDLGRPVADVETLLGNLFFNGLLEDGPAFGLSSQSPTLEFLGQFCDATRLNRNRYLAFDRLCRATFALLGPDDVVHGVAGDLRETGAEALVCQKADDMPAGGAFCIGFHTKEGEDAVGSFFDLAYRRGNDALYVGFGHDEWQLGPLQIAGHSLQYGDWKEQAATLGQARRASRVAVALATQHAVCVAAGVTSASLLDRFTRFGGGRTTTRTLERITSATKEGRDIFAYLSAVAQPPSRFLPPKSYQLHYQEANVRLSAEPLPRLTGCVSVPLPRDGDPIPTDRKSFGVRLLGRILRTAFGYRGGPRSQERVAPTGGNLSSPVAFLVVREVEGVAPGIYRYNGRTHALEKMAGALDIPTRILERMGTAQVYVITFGDLVRVRSKYGAYALSVVGYDSGVAMQYVRSVCSVVGLPQRELPFVDGGLLSACLGLPQLDASLVFVEALALGRTMSSAEGPQLERLVRQVSTTRGPVTLKNEAAKVWNVEGPRQDSGFYRDLKGLSNAIMGRRSVRTFGTDPVPLRRLLTVCDVALAHFDARLAALDSALAARLYVVVGEVVEETAPGIYRVERTASGRVELRAECQLEGQSDVTRLVNQHNVGQAPVLLVPVVAIVDVIERLGPRGFMLVLAIAGAVIAQAWLDAIATGLVGLAYGGLVESELRVRTPSLDRSGLALLTLALGCPDSRPGGRKRSSGLLPQSGRRPRVE